MNSEKDGKREEKRRKEKKESETRVTCRRQWPVRFTLFLWPAITHIPVAVFLLLRVQAHYLITVVLHSLPFFSLSLLVTSRCSIWYPLGLSLFSFVSSLAVSLSLTFGIERLSDTQRTMKVS